MSDEIRRNLALFPIGIVQKLTELTARQIRYYEQHHLIEPTRTEGNQRLFSFNDVERLLEVKRLIDQGLNISGIKKMLAPLPEKAEIPETQEVASSTTTKEMSEDELHDLLQKELMMRIGRNGTGDSLIAGQLSRFYRS